MTNGDGRAGGGVRGAHRDQRGLVAGFVVRTLFVFVILIVCVEEAGQIVLAQTHASCRQSGLLPPEQGAPVVYACMTRLGRDLAGWLGGVEP